MKALLFGIFLFLTASCSQSSLAVARYNFETLETKLLDINEKSARSLMTFLGFFILILLKIGNFAVRLGFV